MTIAVSDTSGNIAITHAGGTKAVSWTSTGGFDFVGAIGLDATTISTTLQVDGLASLNGGIAVDSPNFTIDGTTGTIITAADIDVKGGDVTNTTVGGGLDLEATAAAANTATTFVEISGTTAAHATLTGTDIFLDISPTIGIPTGTAANVHLIDMTFASPAWATAVTSTLRGIYFAPTIGDATTGTNVVALIDIAAIAGDAQVSTYGIRMGAMTATAATENAIDIGATWDYGLKTASPVWIADDQAFTLGTTLTTAATKITMEFDKTTTGVGSFQIGTSDAGQVLEASPGAAVMPMSLNIVHSGGDGDMDDYIGYYNKINVIGAGDSGLTAAAIAARAYVGDDTAVDAVIDELYGMQPWVMHGGVGAITAMSALSAKCNVSADAFTASTVNAAHFHIEGASTVIGQFDGVMIEVYPDVTSMDSGLKVAIDGGAAVTNAIGVSGTATNGLNLTDATLTDDIVLQYGETIDNTVDGTVTVTGNLNCTVPMAYDALLSSTEVDVNPTETTALYTVPTGKSCIITRIVIRSANRSLDQGTDAISNIGFDAATDLVTSATISIVLTATTTWDLLTLVTPGVIGTTTQVLNWHNTTGCTTADSTLQVDVFGYLF